MPPVRPAAARRGASTRGGQRESFAESGVRARWEHAFVSQGTSAVEQNMQLEIPSLPDFSWIVYYASAHFALRSLSEPKALSVF